MGPKVLNLEATSPEALDETLSSLLKKEKLHHRLAGLSIAGPQVLVRQFELPLLSLRELKNSLSLEAVELLSLPPDEIELDYQITESAADKIKGVFVAIPKKLLAAYLLSLRKAKLIPLTITADILSIVDSFLNKSHLENKNFYLLHFVKDNSIHLAVFNQGNCELLRGITYENINEAKQEILHSLRYASGKSSYKQPEEVYLAGDLSDKQELVPDLEKELNLNFKQIDLTETAPEIFLRKGYFKINLIEKYALSFSLRQKISQVLNLLIVVAILTGLMMIKDIIKTGPIIKSLRKELNSSAKIKDYNYARGLQDKMNSLSHEK